MHHPSRQSPARRLRWALACAVLTSVAPTAFGQAAGSSTGVPAPLAPLGEMYVELTGGPTDFSRTRSGVGNFAREDHTTAYGVAIGHYAMHPNWGLEAGYTNFGEVAKAGGTTKAEGINLSVVGRFPMNESLNLLGKVGTMYGHTEVSANPASTLATGSEYGFDWSYGIGAEVKLSPQWSGVLQYGEHFMKFAGNSSERVTATTIGIRMRY